MVVATLAVNIAANVVSPANDFAERVSQMDFFPHRRIDYRHRRHPHAALAAARPIHPGYIFSWLVGYSGGLGSIAGVLIADYWLVRSKDLALGDLYRRRGDYTFLVVGTCAPSLLP